RAAAVTEAAFTKQGTPSSPTSSTCRVRHVTLSERNPRYELHSMPMIKTGFPRAVLFDLLTALIDSWSLWDAVAGSQEAGRAWRAEYLRLTYGCGAYVPYEHLVRAAARTGGVAGQRGRCAASALARACAVERRAGGGRRVARQDQAWCDHQLLAAARTAGGGTIEHALGLRRHCRDGRPLQARPAALPSRAR